MGDALLSTIGVGTVCLLLGAGRHLWRHRKVVVWDHERHEWRAAGRVMEDRHHQPERQP